MVKEIKSSKSPFEDMITGLEKKYGKGTIIKLDGGALKGIPVIATGIPQLDKALGVGGLPKGRIIEIFGPESGGKTTLALKAISQCQAQGGKAGFVDVEHAFDPSWAKKLGVDVGKLIFAQPDSAEEALDIAENMVKGGLDMVILDSVAALVPQAELNGEYGESHMGLQARLMGQAMRKMKSHVKHAESVLIMINQIRLKIGVMFGNPETTPAGLALKFATSVRIDIRAVKSTHKDKSLSTRRIKVVKNKVAPPFKICDVTFVENVGFDTMENLFQGLCDYGIIKHTKGKNSCYTYDGVNLGNNRKLAKEKFEKVTDDSFGEVYQQYLDAMSDPVAVEEDGDEEGDE
jgi:recombination protein RecA